jgi:hypothetical protein
MLLEAKVLEDGLRNEDVDFGGEAFPRVKLHYNQ